MNSARIVPTQTNAASKQVVASFEREKVFFQNNERKGPENSRGWFCLETRVTGANKILLALRVKKKLDMLFAITGGSDDESGRNYGGYSRRYLSGLILSAHTDGDGYLRPQPPHVEGVFGFAMPRGLLRTTWVSTNASDRSGIMSLEPGESCALHRTVHCSSQPSLVYAGTWIHAIR
ncbi:hypothetical protein NPX13_g1449 [Xylaria arbuscula]|uniref:Uncharacterized protein n=1 Tax=Xylaria arbuscula TaxID=114810 RepID=A0A9W8TRU6_9PEZI|nr:hypothetical protein NPX13_g1449 [Xylaria arbuscula]